MKALLKRLMAMTPYRIVRATQNRFDAMEHSLRFLQRRGYRPQVIVDGGAHLGSFARMAAEIFPDARIHIVEPQPACLPSLEKLALERGFILHPVALGSLDDHAAGAVKFFATDVPGTGANVGPDGPMEVHAEALDRMFAFKLDERALLKLDLQGYELHALKGGIETLKSVEVILTEVSFFDEGIAPALADLIAFLAKADFEIFDVASLYGRNRDNRLKQGDLIFVKRGSVLSADTAWA